MVKNGPKIGQNGLVFTYVVVLACPHKATAALEGLGHHIIDQAMLVPHPSRLKVLAVRRLVHLGKDVHETTIVLFQNLYDK